MANETGAQELFINDNGSLCGLPSGDFILAEDLGTLRDYFLWERDEQLGRWRHPERSELVLYRRSDLDDSQGRCVIITNEATGKADGVWEHGERGDDLNAICSDYFAAHPEPKPWHGAVHEEVWKLTVNGDTGPMLAANALSGPVFFRAANGDQFVATDEQITAGHRLYPPVKS